MTKAIAVAVLTLIAAFLAPPDADARYFPAPLTDAAPMVHLVQGFDPTCFAKCHTGCVALRVKGSTCKPGRKNPSPDQGKCLAFAQQCAPECQAWCSKPKAPGNLRVR